MNTPPPLHRLTVTCQRRSLPYPRAYQVVIRGLVPAIRDTRGWLISEADEPALVAAVAALPTRARPTAI